MTPEEIAAKAAADVARHESDVTLLRSIGIALEAEVTRRRNADEAPLDNVSAAAFIAALPV